MVKFYSINGQVLPREQAMISVDDLVILRGYGLFDFFLVRQGRPLFLEDHFDRFHHSAEVMRLKIPLSREELAKAVYDVIEANGMEEASMRLVLTGGYSPNAYDLPDEQNLLILQHPYPRYPEHQYQNGIKLLLHEYLRAFPTAKSTNYAMNLSLQPDLQAAKAKGVLYHWEGKIYEMAVANFYIVTKDDVIVTPEKNILKGITRKKILEIAQGQCQVEERDIHLDELKTCKEAFMTNSTRRLMSVVQIDDQVIGDGKPGEIAPKLRSQLFAAEKAYLRAAAK